MNTTAKPAAASSAKKPEAPEIPPVGGEQKPASGSAAEAALRKDDPKFKEEGRNIEKEEEEEEKEEVPKEVPYTEPMTHVVPAPNPAYKAPQEPPLGSKRLADEQAAGKKALEARASNKVQETKSSKTEAPKPAGTAPPAPPPKK